MARLREERRSMDANHARTLALHRRYVAESAAAVR
jgi:hypothetical protein